MVIQRTSHEKILSKLQLNCQGHSTIQKTIKLIQVADGTEPLYFKSLDLGCFCSGGSFPTLFQWYVGIRIFQHNDQTPSNGAVGGHCSVVCLINCSD